MVPDVLDGQFTGPNLVGQHRVQREKITVANQGTKAGELVIGRRAGKLAFDDAQSVDGDLGVEGKAAIQGRAGLMLEKLSDGGDEFGGGRAFGEHGDLLREQQE
jgi:hypothetical protein